jgi:hypothetical protein
MHMNPMDVRIRTPANYYICGQSQSGKSHLVRSMLDHLEELFYPVPTRILYCCGEHQKEFDDLSQRLSNIEFVDGFPNDLYALVEGHDNSLVILDDLMSQCSNDTTFCWHNFFSVNIKRLYTEVDLSRPTNVCRKNTKWQPCFIPIHYVLHEV